MITINPHGLMNNYAKVNGERVHFSDTWFPLVAALVLNPNRPFNLDDIAKLYGGLDKVPLTFTAHHGSGVVLWILNKQVGYRAFYSISKFGFVYDPDPSRINGNIGNRTYSG